MTTGTLRPIAVLAALALALGACGTDDDPFEVTAPVTEPPDRQPPATHPATSAPATMGDPEVSFTEVVSLELPVNLAWRTNDHRLFVLEQEGRIIAVDPETGSADEVLDVTGLTEARRERGLLGLAFAPGNELAYINYYDLNGDTVVAEYRVDADGIFDPSSARTVLQIDQPFDNHNGGHVVFGPDDLLYVGMGDGGSGGDPERLALDLGSLHGKLLRIDPTPVNDAPYSIPDDNPFLDVDGARPEIFAIGLRNPWKFTFDPLTGDLWIADVGQNEIEEINFVPDTSDNTVAGSGLSFGWSAFEGDQRFNTDQDPDDHTDPVFTYRNNVDGCSISGGAPYRGEAIPELSGGYVYSDYCSGTIWAFDIDSGRNLELGSQQSVTAVLPGPDQELYVLSHTGSVLRIEPAG